MPVPDRSPRWPDNPSVQFTLAAMLLILGVAWLLFTRPDGWSHWLFAAASLTAGVTWLIRGIKHLTGKPPTNT